MIEELEKRIRKQHIIEEQDIVLAAVSGGADSVCLLFLLHELRKKMDFSLSVIHVEHGIRGEESVADALFVQKLCEELEIPMSRYDVDVPAYSTTNGLGEEEAARLLRYECFEKEAKKLRATGRNVKVALAHHADDNAETILFQMVRGSGLDGLCGMQPMRELSDGIDLIRPLLDVRRTEIEAYLKEIKQNFRTDATNANIEYSRNKIRHEVLPLLTEVNTQAVAHINQSAQILREMSDYIEVQTTEAYEKCCKTHGSGILIAQKLWEEYPKVLQREVLHKALETVAGSKKDLTSVHLSDLDDLSGKQVGRTLSLPYQMEAKRQYEGILIQKKITEDVTIDEDFFSLTREELLEAECESGFTRQISNTRWQFRVLHFKGNMEEISQKAYTKWLDYDKIESGLQIRKRRQGDYLTVDTEGHTKKLKQYFVNEKVPQEARGTIWLLAEDSHILWIVGGRISAFYKVSKDTKRVLEVRFTEANHEDQKD